jgi:hypothetical protein
MSFGYDDDMSNTTTAPVINPNCHACHGTGTDDVFGTTCSECERDASLAQRRFAGDGRVERVHQPGERMDGRTFGSRQTATNEATERQIAFITKLISERDRTDERTNAVCETIEMLIADGHMNKQAASASIDTLKALPVARPTGTTTTATATGSVRVNRFPGSCGHCAENVAEGQGRIAKVNGRWVTFHLDGQCPEPAAESGIDLTPLTALMSRGKVRFGIPGSDTRLKLMVQQWRNGAIVVKDAAVYGQGKRYGKQTPGHTYSGDVTAELEAVLADPMAAVKRYAELTSQCGICGAPLEDEASVARGMGPICARKF